MHLERALAWRPLYKAPYIGEKMFEGDISFLQRMFDKIFLNIIVDKAISFGTINFLVCRLVNLIYIAIFILLVLGSLKKSEFSGIKDLVL